MKRSGPSSRKAHNPAFTGDLIALGTKSGSSKPSRHTDEPKPGASLKQVGSGASPLSQPPAKKQKLAKEGSGGLFSDPIRVSQVTQPQPIIAKGGQGLVAKSPYSQQSGPGGSSIGGAAQVIEVHPVELVSTLREARSSGNDTKATRVLAGALKQLRLSRLKPDSTLNAALTSLAKEDSKLFNNPTAIEGLVAVLKREPSAIFKTKSNPSVYTLASQLLLVALGDSYDWPESVAKVYIEDSLGDRLWVDLESCRKLVDNICTIFQTRPYSPGSSSGSSSGSGSSSTGVHTQAPKTGQAGETSSASGQGGKREGDGGSGAGGEAEQSGELSLEDVEVAPRFSPPSIKSLKAYILHLVGEQMGRHGDISRNFLRFLTTAAGLPDIRLKVAQKIEGWIQNPKLGKQCQDLLMTVAVNCHTHSPEDLRVVDALINVRLKTKLFSNQFVACIRELISSHPANLETVLRGVVTNELGQLRSPSNMALIAMMVHTWPEEAAKLLGVVFQEFLTRKEDYLRALRGFLREVIRQVRNEFNFSAFTRSLMQERQETEFTQLDPAHKERMALSLADLITCSCLLTANMLIREAYNGYSKGEKVMVPQLREFFTTLGLVQRDAVWWIHTVVPGTFRPQPVDYKLCLRKCLFLEPAETYHGKDNWPPESDRSLILHMMTEAFLEEDTLMRVLVIGLTRELPLSPADALDIADKLVARAANAHTEDIPRLPAIERKELFNIVFDTTAYRAPPNIQLPEDYQSPALAISKLYWKGWLLLLVLSAFNPKTIGALGWSEYPTLRGMMEMVMTNTYTFPSSMTLVTSDSGSVESKDNAIARELQLSRSEKEAILEYEGHLASSSTSSSSSQGTTITEANSFLLNQVTLLKPKGAARRLPTTVIELVKTVNRSLKLGQLLCRCRSPDFLLDIIKRQGTLESMKWLTELVESSHSSLDVLPTPCLCEFLMASYQEQGSPTYETEADPSSHRAQYKRKKLAKDKAQGRHRQLVTQLRNLLLGPQSSPQSCLEVMEYFFEKLTLSQLTPRSLALKALREILGRGGASRVGGGGGKEGGGGELSDDTEDEELLTSGEWLVTILPSLTHFTSILPRTCLLLLQACLVETKLQCLQGFILFLTQYSPQEKLYEVSIGISQIIVDRFVVVRKLFQKDSSAEPSPSDVDATLSSLLSMLRITMETAIHSQTMPQLSSSDDFLLVSFPTGQKTILHTALIQAVFLLLTCNPPINQSDYTYLLNMWFPVDATKLPEAYTVDDREKVTLPPDAILQYMFYATNTRVLGATIRTAQLEQLCTFVQQFGIPVQSVEKVLERLDSMCESASMEDVFVEGVENPVLLSQSVQVQMLRGVKSGKIFLSYLQRHANLPQKPMKDLSALLELSTEPTSVAKQPQPSHTKLERREIPRIPQERTEQLLLQIFAPSLSRISAPPQEVQKLKLDLEQGLKNLVISSLATKVGCGITNAETLNADISGLIAALHKLITSSSIRRQFLEGLVRSSFSITLLRLITRIQKMKKMGGISAGLFKATLQYLLGASESLKSPSSSALVSFQATVKSCAEQLGVKHTSEGGDVVLKWSKLVAKTCKEISEVRSPFEAEGALIRTCQSLTQGNVVLIEDIIRAVAKQAVSLGKEAKCIELLDKIRSFPSKNPPIVLQYSPEIFIPNQAEIDSEDGSTEHDSPPEMMDFAEQGSSEGFSTAHTLDLTGLFVDWVQLLDPEVLSLCPESMQQIVFSGNSQQFSTLPTSTPHPSPSLLICGQGYLLARLTHESTWMTVTKTISALLDSGQLKEWVDPSAVLDFLWACLHNPSLWQGRVKKEAVINSYISMGIDEESQLILTPSQLECLVDCILKEAAAACVGMELTGSSGSEKETEVPPEAKTLLYSRLPLLTCCFNGNQPALKIVIKHLQTHSSYPSLGWQLLVLLYHANERVILLVDHAHPLSTAALSATAPCKLDTELHNLLSAMADAHPGQESVQRMTNAALLCRKITIRHPALMLRQLPMLGWLLRGRAHLNPVEFRNRNHKQVFINAFALLDLLQPLVFENSQSDALDACLEPFFDFLKNQCVESKKYQSMVARFSDFLVRYAQHNRDKAAALIYRHLDTLQALSENQQSKKSSLRSLVECFPMKKTKGEEMANENSLHGWGTMMIVPPLTSSHTLSHEQVMPFLKKLEQGQLREDILKVLHDLEETSLHSVDILKHFVPELCRIIQDEEPTSCKLAHSLLLRHLKQSPSTVDEFLPAFIGCLESHDYNIVMAAVGSIPDLVLLCKAKDAGALLKQLFLLATQFRYSCTSELIRAIEACTQHTFR